MTEHNAIHLDVRWPDDRETDYDAKSYRYLVQLKDGFFVFCRNVHFSGTKQSRHVSAVYAKSYQIWMGTFRVEPDETRARVRLKLIPGKYRVVAVRYPNDTIKPSPNGFTIIEDGVIDMNSMQREIEDSKVFTTTTGCAQKGEPEENKLKVHPLKQQIALEIAETLSTRSNINQLGEVFRLKLGNAIAKEMTSDELVQAAKALGLL